MSLQHTTMAGFFEFSENTRKFESNLVCVECGCPTNDVYKRFPGGITKLQRCVSSHLKNAKNHPYTCACQFDQLLGPNDAIVSSPSAQRCIINDYLAHRYHRNLFNASRVYNTKNKTTTNLKELQQNLKIKVEQKCMNIVIL